MNLLALGMLKQLCFTAFTEHWKLPLLPKVLKLCFQYAAQVSGTFV